MLTHQELNVNFYKVDVTLDFVEEGDGLLASHALVPFASYQVNNLPKPIVVQQFFQKFGPLHI